MDINRKDELIKSLTVRGLEFREDSKLCLKYINKETELSLDTIVQRLCEMKYLYDYCDFEKIKTNVYFNLKKKNKDKDIPINTNKVALIAKKIALKKFSNNIYPVKFPWEVNDLQKNNFLINNILIFIALYCLFVMSLPVTIYFLIKVILK